MTALALFGLARAATQQWPSASGLSAHLAALLAWFDRKRTPLPLRPRFLVWSSPAWTTTQVRLWQAAVSQREREGKGQGEGGGRRGKGEGKEEREGEPQGERVGKREGMGKRKEKQKGRQKASLMVKACFLSSPPCLQWHEPDSTSRPVWA